MRQHFWDNSNGFTLIETIIALSIISIIGLASFTLIKRGVAARKSQRRVSTKLMENSAALTRFARDISNAQPAPFSNFRCTGDSLIFTISNIGPAASVSVAQIIYSIEAAKTFGEKTLNVKETEFNGTLSGQRLLSGITEMEFSCLQRYVEGNAWETIWDEDSSLPPAVRLRLTLPGSADEKEFIFPIRGQREISFAGE